MVSLIFCLTSVVPYNGKSSVVSRSRIARKGASNAAHSRSNANGSSSRSVRRSLQATHWQSEQTPCPGAPMCSSAKAKTTIKTNAAMRNLGDIGIRATPFSIITNIIAYCA